MAERVTLWFDGRIRVEVDADEFEIIKMMMQDAGADKNLFKTMVVVNDLVKQGYTKGEAMRLCILARSELNKT